MEHELNLQKLKYLFPPPPSHPKAVISNDGHESAGSYCVVLVGHQIPVATVILMKVTVAQTTPLSAHSFKWVKGHTGYSGTTAWHHCLSLHCNILDNYCNMAHFAQDTVA